MSKYVIDSETLTDIADAIRSKTGGSGAIATEDMADEIGAIPSEGGGWVRPDEYPDIDALADGIVGDQDCMYLTYDLRKSEEFRWICLYAKTANSSAWTVDRGHVENGSFVVDATNTITSSSYLRQELDINNGEVQLFRVTATGHITNFGFATKSNTASENWQNIMQVCVQRSGTLPWLESLYSNIGTNYNSTAYSTSWMERDALVPGKNAVITSMGNCWSRSYHLQSLDVSKWDTKNWEVTRIDYCWNDCFKLRSLDVSKWDTSNWEVTNIYYMCCNCYELKELDLSGWDTSKWHDVSMSYCWNNCISLRSLDISTWDTSNWNVSSMTQTWNNCQCLTELDLSVFGGSEWSVGNNNNFVNCNNLKKLKGTDTWDWATAMTVNLYAPNIPNLVDFDGIPYSVNHSYNNAVSLSHTSLINILNTLPTVSVAKTITLGQTNKVKLTSAEIAIATQKGWTVA